MDKLPACTYWQEELPGGKRLVGRILRHAPPSYSYFFGSTKDSVYEFQSYVIRSEGTHAILFRRLKRAPADYRRDRAAASVAT